MRKYNFPIGLALVACLLIIFALGFSVGYEHATRSAQLTSHNQDGYTITYNGVDHWYEYGN